MAIFTAQGNGIYVSIDNVGNIATSVDNITWTPSTQPFTSVDAHWSYNGISFGGGIFTAFGNHIVIASNALPGSSWSTTIITGGNWLSATFDGSKWFLVDDEGRTATSIGQYPGNWEMTNATIPIIPHDLITDGLFI